MQETRGEEEKEDDTSQVDYHEFLLSRHDRASLKDVVLYIGTSIFFMQVCCQIASSLMCWHVPALRTGS